MENCLITGGTGTFGRAFARRLLENDLVERVVILSRDEWKQAEMRVEFRDFPRARLRFYLGDIRDRIRLERAFQSVDTVIHAAALKQVQRGGEAFDEFIKTNVIGSLNVISACHRAGVKKCLALSTDKAVEATTPYGVSKAVTEFAFIGGSAWGSCRFALTRYGNVLGSRGSVLETWRKQYESDQPLTITDVNMTRFWMTIEEAVDLILLALDRMHGGEIFVPKGVKRGTVHALAKKHFPQVGLVRGSFEITGKRSYEKMHEKLIADEEVDRVRDCGDVYVVQPLHVRWAPGPYGSDCPSVPQGFSYRSGPRTNGG